MKAGIDAQSLSTPLCKGALSIVSRLAEAGFRAFFVGGAPRDILLGRQPKDIDIASAATPETIKKLFPHSHCIGAAFGVMTVVEGGIPYEVATFREERDYMDGRHPEGVSYTDDPRLDVMRRDFTVNGLLLDPLQGEILDHVGGLDDLRTGVLRAIGDPEARLSEDYLRMLRAVRFCVRLRMDMDSATEASIRKLAPKIKALSAERMRDEFDRMLAGPEPSRAFRMLSNFGLLKEALPELEALRGVEQPKEHHPEGDVFEHTMLMLDRLPRPWPELAWSILMHDVAKPMTFSRDSDGIEHFYSHETAGAGMALKILGRLKMPKAFCSEVAQAVRNHMKFAHVHVMKRAKWRRMVADPNFPLEMELHRIDCMASHGKLSNYVLMLDRVVELASEPALPPPLITGFDLIAMDVQPGPEMGEILREVADLQLEGALHTKEEALNFLRSAKGIVP